MASTGEEKRGRRFFMHVLIGFHNIILFFPMDDGWPYATLLPTQPGMRRVGLDYSAHCSL